ncbi:MAG: signal peptidase I [Bacilli bacterium]|jgi:signal peptidase I|nr:signal peptidase I [Bacilli bacterium]
MENFLNGLKELLPYIIIIIVVIVIRTFFFTPVLVNGDSMKPTLKDKQLLLLNKYDKKLKRFDIVVLTRENNEKLIKRIIGLPGEYVEYKNGKLYIDGKIVKDNFAKFTNDFFLEAISLELKEIPKGKYLVLGDNRNNSIDSRTIGLIDEKDISGKITFSIWPIKKIKNA